MDLIPNQRYTVESLPPPTAFDTLPDEMLLELTVRLDEVSLGNFGATCRRMRAIVKPFWDSQLEKPGPKGMSSKEWYGCYVRRCKRFGISDYCLKWFSQHPSVFQKPVHLQDGWMFGVPNTVKLMMCDYGNDWRIKATLWRNRYGFSEITRISLVLEGQDWVESHEFQPGGKHSWWVAIRCQDIFDKRIVNTNYINTSAFYIGRDWFFFHARNRANPSFLLPALIQTGSCEMQSWHPTHTEDDYFLLSCAAVKEGFAPFMMEFEHIEKPHPIKQVARSWIRRFTTPDHWQGIRLTNRSK